MKQCYSHKCSATKLAVVDLYYAVEMQMWVISRINTPAPFRRRGIAARLMEEVLEDADNEEVWLALWINAYGDMTHDQLRDWYGRLGFESSSGHEDEECLARPPQKDRE